MMIAFKGFASCVLCFGNKRFRIPSNQPKLVYVERIEKLARTNSYCVRRHSNEQHSLSVKQHMVIEASRLLVRAEPLAVPGAKPDAMSVKSLAKKHAEQDLANPLLADLAAKGGSASAFSRRHRWPDRYDAIGHIQRRAPMRDNDARYRQTQDSFVDRPFVLLVQMAGGFVEQ